MKVSKRAQEVPPTSPTAELPAPVYLLSSLSNLSNSISYYLTEHFSNESKQPNVVFNTKPQLQSSNLIFTEFQRLKGFIDKTNYEMQTADKFLAFSWNFVKDTENGTEDIWWILEGQDYPRLFWELNSIP
jgi:hypothetical protein